MPVTKFGPQLKHPVDSTQTLEVQRSNLVNLRGSVIQEKPKVDDTNSLRNVHKFVTTRSSFIGVQIANLLCKRSDDEPHMQEKILSLIGKQPGEHDIPHDWIQTIRTDVRDLIVRNKLPHMEQVCDVEPISENGYNTVIRGHLLHYWAQAVGDPASCAAEWTFIAAPAGLNRDTKCLDGLCPMVDDSKEQEKSIGDLDTDFQTFENYSGVEDDPGALSAIEGYHQKGYLKKFTNLHDVERFVGAKPVLSKLGCIKRENGTQRRRVSRTRPASFWIANRHWHWCQRWHRGQNH